MTKSLKIKTHYSVFKTGEMCPLLLFVICSRIVTDKYVEKLAKHSYISSKSCNIKTMRISFLFFLIFFVLVTHGMVIKNFEGILAKQGGKITQKENLPKRTGKPGMAQILLSFPSKKKYSKGF